jgi:hypothetical protein
MLERIDRANLRFTPSYLIYNFVGREAFQIDMPEVSQFGRFGPRSLCILPS